MTEDEVRELHKQKRRRDRYEAIYGPVRIADTVIWELWVEFEGEYQTRFVEEESGAEPIIYDTFQALALKLQDRHLSLMNRLQIAEQAKGMDQVRLQSDLAMKAADGASRRFSAMMKDLVAATGFVVALACFVYLVAIGQNVVAAIVMLAGIAASACAYYYGKFILVKFRELFGT